MDPLTIAAITAGSSLIGELFSSSEAKKQRQRTIDAYKKLLIPYNETRMRADKVGDTVYTKAMNEINSGAFQYAGALNSDTLSALAVSKMIEARSSAELQAEQQDYNYNKQIQAKVAEAEALPTPSVNIANVIEEGIGGFLAGKQLEMTESLNKTLMDYYGLLNTNQPKTVNNSNTTDTLNIGITQKSALKSNFNLKLNTDNPLTDESYLDSLLSFQRKKKLWL